MTTYVYKNGVAVDKATGEPMLTAEDKAKPVGMPMVMGFQAYTCPITGKPISTLQQHNDNLKKHNCVEALEVNRSGATNGEIRNARFAKKRGLELSSRYKDEAWSPKGAKENGQRAAIG